MALREWFCSSSADDIIYGNGAASALANAAALAAAEATGMLSSEEELGPSSPKQESLGSPKHENRSEEEEGEEATSDTVSRAGSEWSRLAWWGETRSEVDARDNTMDFLHRAGFVFGRPRVAETRHRAAAVLENLKESAREKRHNVGAYVDRKVEKMAEKRERLKMRKDDAMAVIKRAAREKKRKMAARAQAAAGKAGHLKDKAKDKASEMKEAAKEKLANSREKIRDKAVAMREEAAAAREKLRDKMRPMAERREAAQAVIRHKILELRERRAARREGRADGSTRSRSFGRRGKRKGRHSREGSWGGRAVERPTSQSPPPTDGRGSAALFHGTELLLARQMRRDGDQTRGCPPSDHPEADLIYQKKDLSLWKWKGEAKEGGSGKEVDEYESEFEVPVSIESFLAMQCQVEGRKDWDSNTKRVECMQASGPNDLGYVHNQGGDDQYIFWLVGAPWPLQDREYIMHRRVARIYGTSAAAQAAEEAKAAAAAAVAAAASDGAAIAAAPAPAGKPMPFLRDQELYIRFDIADDGQMSRQLRPTVTNKASRCIDLFSVQVAWYGGEGILRVRSRYREDPMMALPGWILRMITDKMVPRGLKALKSAAIELDRQRLEKRDPPAAAPERRGRGRKARSPKPPLIEKRVSERASHLAPSERASSARASAGSGTGSEGEASAPASPLK